TGGRYRFDFGTARSPVWPGFTRISPETVLGAAGFGWDAAVSDGATTEIRAGHRGAPDALAGGFLLPGDRAFVGRLAPGRYEGAALADGRDEYGLATRSFAIEVNGKRLVRVGVGPVQFYSPQGYYLGIDDDPTEPRGDAWERFVQPDFPCRRFRFEARDPETRIRFRDCRVYALVLARAAAAESGPGRREGAAAAPAALAG